MKKIFQFTISDKEEKWFDAVRKVVKKNYHLLPVDEDGLVWGGFMNHYDWLVENKIIESIKLSPKHID